MTKIKRKPIILLSTIMLILISSLSIFAQSRKGYGKPVATYKAPEGFTIISYSKKWNTASGLKEISKELLANEHGEEIAYLKDIYLYPDSPDGVLAYTHYDLTRNSQGKYQYSNGRIEIFDADQYKGAKDMAWVLAHEYGHHFTIYHMVTKENKFYNEWKNTNYAKARNIANNSNIYYVEAVHADAREWDIMEIAAQDYVQLFASSNAKRSMIYKDIQQKVSGNISNHFNYTPAFNMRPQDNMQLPLAADVAGLEAYWRNLANLPKKTITPLASKPKMHLVTKKELAKGAYQYRIEWDEIPGNDKYEYTLVAYPEGGHAFPYPIKTVKTGESTYAIIGNALKANLKTGTQELIADDYQGKYIFNLYIKDSRNKIYKGVPLHVNFNYPVIEHKGLYKDMHPTDWSYDGIKQLNDRGIMLGSPDQYFYPFRPVTHIELTAVLSRIGGRVSLDKKQNITRDDIALVLYEYITSKNLKINEVNKASNFKDQSKIKNKKEVDYLYRINLMGGNDGYYYPSNYVTRQELAVIIVRLLRHQ